MESISHLQGRLAATNRAARNLVAEGGTFPSPANRAAFDALMRDVERTEALIDLHNAAAPEPISMRWAREHVIFDRFLREGDSNDPGIRNVMTTTTGSQGGYAVPSLVAADIMSYLSGYGWMRQVATILPTAGGAPMGYPAADATAQKGERVDQNAAAAAADPTFTTASLATTKYSSKIITLPWELLQDSASDIVGFVAQCMADRVGRIQNDDFTTGTGTNQPTGVATAAGVGKLGTTGQTATVLYDDLVDLVDSVDEVYLGMPSKQAGVPDRNRCGFMMSQTARKMVRKIKDSNGRPIFIPAATLQDVPQLLDFPVFINNSVPVPAASAKSILFGGLQRYVIRDVQEIAIHRLAGSEYVKMGQVGFLMFVRSGGALPDTSAVKAYQHPAS